MQPFKGAAINKQRNEAERPARLPAHRFTVGLPPRGDKARIDGIPAAA